MLFSVAIYYFSVLEKNKIKYVKKQINKIEIYLKKLNKINDQFHELSKKNSQYKKLEKSCAENIFEIESIYSNVIVEYDKLIRIFESKKFKKSDFNNIYKKIKVYLKSIKIKIKNTKKWSLIETKSKEVLDVLNFINKSNNIISNIVKILKNNKNNSFIEKNRDEINKRLNRIIFFVEELDVLDFDLLDCLKLAYKKEEFNKELTYFVSYIENGLSIIDFVEKNIEIPFIFLNDLIKESKKFPTIFQQILKNDFLNSISNKIDTLKENLNKSDVLKWRDFFEDTIILLSKEIYEKSQLVNNELQSIFKLTENQGKILKLLDEIDNNHRELLKTNNIHYQYIKLSNDFYNNEYIYFDFIKTKNLDKVTNVSFYNKLNELNYLLNKAKEILKIQNSLLKNKSAINSNNFKEEINNKYLQAFSFHDFNYEIDKEIIKYQKKYLSFVEANNFEDQEFLLLLIKNIKTKILLLNLKIKIANYLVKNFNFLTKNLYHKENIEIINFFYQKKYDEVIHKTIELITKNKRK